MLQRILALQTQSKLDIESIKPLFEHACLHAQHMQGGPSRLQIIMLHQPAFGRESYMLVRTCVKHLICL